ncbi:MAG: NusG domain II-containing protein [Tissierellia bacterium]|nr:NusG domain II-containing protein [Tissierellia bacterium]
MKKGDIITIFIIIVLGLSFLIFINRTQNQTGNSYISIQVDGKEIKKIEFDENTIGTEYEINNEFGYNKLEIGENRVRVIEADCKDKIDVKQGWISKPGETLVCLPHKLVIEIKSEDSDGDIDHINY